MAKKGRIVSFAAGAFVFAGLLAIIYFTMERDARSPQKDELLCTSYPLYKITENLTRDLDVSLSYIDSAQSGCSHDYSLTPRDRMRVEQADLLIIVGRGMDEGMLRRTGERKSGTLINSSATVSDLIFYDKHHVNPHFFVAPRYRIEMAREIASGLIQFQPDWKTTVELNRDLYLRELEALVQEGEALRPKLAGLKVLVQHASLDYLAAELGFEVAGVLQGADGEELSSAGMLKLLRLIREEQVQAIVNEPGYSDRIARTLAKEAGIAFFELDPVTSGGEDASAEDYFGRMRANYHQLEQFAAEILQGAGS